MKMLCFLLCACVAFAEDITLNNQSVYPAKNQSKMAVQWASSGREVDAENHALVSGKAPNSNSLQAIGLQGKVQLAIPKAAEYFRVLVWSTAKNAPDLITNWVEIVPNKSYTLTTDHLFPSVLMYGTGC